MTFWLIVHANMAGTVTDFKHGVEAPDADAALVRYGELVSPSLNEGEQIFAVKLEGPLVGSGGEVERTE